MHRILHNAAVDHLRRDRENPTEEVALLVERRWREESYTVDAAVVATRTQTAEEIKDALLRLPLMYRTVLVLHDMEGFTVVEIARIQGVGLAAAKQRLRRGRMMLVSALGRWCGAPRRPTRCAVDLLGCAIAGLRLPR